MFGIHRNALFSSVGATIAAVLCLPTTVEPATAQSSSPPSRPLRKDKDEIDTTYRAPSTIRGKTVLIPIGTTWEGIVDKTISSDHSHGGQRFNIVMSSPVLVNGTDVVVPAGSAIIGEVVEAVPASQVQPKMNQPKYDVRGKLRISVSGLRTPDGTTYPLVGNLAGEIEHRDRWGMHRGKLPTGTSVGYSGTNANFEVVNPNQEGFTYDKFGKKIRRVVTKNDLLKDQMYGAGEDGIWKDENVVRSLVLHGRDYYIYAGSPLTIRLMAPFRIGMTPMDLGIPVGTAKEEPAEDAPPQLNAPTVVAPTRDRAPVSTPAPVNPTPTSVPADSF